MSDECDAGREVEVQEPQPQGEREGEGEGCSFEWDETSQLYFHSSSGFYHDPTAGWYYSSRDGLYYKFEDGNYVPMVSVEVNVGPLTKGFALADQSEINDNVTNVPNTSNQDQLDTNGTRANSFEGDDTEVHRLGFSIDELPIVDPESNGEVPEYPPPPSEWLEDTLIDLYLSGHSNREANIAQDERISAERDHGDALENDDVYELEDGEWIPDEGHNVDYASESVSDEGISWDEENWRAQYGQVIHASEETHPKISTTDLWDWSLAKEAKRKRKRQFAHLVGRLVRQSTQLHPSMPLGGRLLKTAPICEAQLDLVRVRTGKVYKLKTPSAKYLASLSTFDSANPTKDWGFPELSFDMQIQDPQGLSVNSGAKVIKGVPILIAPTLLPEKNGSEVYRDRAAERRALHGGFGVGPGQKIHTSGDDCEPSYPVLPEEAAGEALNMSFGAGSYARKLLENMGWKEGNALGNSSKGLIEPLQAVGNKGNAGLGWEQNRTKRV